VSLVTALTAEHAVILDAHKSRLLPLARELAERDRSESGTDVKQRLQPLIVKCLNSWRAKLHHEHPFDIHKRSYHPVFSAIDLHQPLEQSELAREIEYLNATYELLTRLLDNLHGDTIIWKERLDAVAALNAALRRQAQAPDHPEEAKQLLDRAEFVFRPAGTEVIS
jgi:hypothetical protein